MTLMCLEPAESRAFPINLRPDWQLRDVASCDVVYE